METASDQRALLRYKHSLQLFSLQWKLRLIKGLYRGGYSRHLLTSCKARAKHNILVVRLLRMPEMVAKPLATIETPGAFLGGLRGVIMQLMTMVTGDYGLTAEAIARRIGLVDGKSRVVTGEDMGHLSDAQLRQILHQKSGLVFARVMPEQKLRLVQAYIAMGHIVAVTGDD